MPAPKVKPLAEVASKWGRRAASAGPEYENGVRNPSGDWQAGSVAAKGAWQLGVTQAAARDAFSKGVTQAGNTRWQEKAISKGPSRFADGVSKGEGDYQKNVAPYLDAIARTDLPARGPAGSEANLNRMQAIPRALAALKRR